MPTDAGGAKVSLPIREGVRFEGVTYSYPGNSGAALNDVSLEMRAGETVAIVGENGAGKTTLVKILARLYVPDRGRVTVDGCDLNQLDADAWRRHIGVIFQDIIQYYLTAAEDIGFGEIARSIGSTPGRSRWTSIYRSGLFQTWHVRPPTPWHTSRRVSRKPFRP
jgi:ABC-type multidrug transport system fused ATPase/permease subunit